MNQELYCLISCDEGITRTEYKPFLASQSNEWTFFQAARGELPDVKKMSEYKGIIIGGSLHSANDNFPWIGMLESFVRDVLKYQLNNEVAPKLLGVCFGHQLICKVLGAKVVKNQSGHFAFSLHDIDAKEEMKKMKCYEEVFGREDSFVLFQAHSEEVIDIPTGVKVLASSKNCGNEVISYGDKCLSFQSHMDTNNEQLMAIVFPTLKKEGLLGEREERLMWENFIKKQNDRGKVIQMMMKYIQE